MINNWHVPRNKRKLYPVVDILSLFTLQNLGEIWNHDLARQLNFEAELERFGIKSDGERRDQKAGGARTYESWLYALGLIFEETNTEVIRTTLAGDALLAGESPVPIIRNQLMKLQYPSPYSIRSGVGIHSRFQVRPFRFLLQILLDSRLKKANGRIELTKQEIGLFCLTEAENETKRCLDHVVNRILAFRSRGDAIIPSNFGILHPSSRKKEARSKNDAMKALIDNANVFINFLEYTQLVKRDKRNLPIYIPEQKRKDVETILNDNTRLRKLDTDNPYGLENFQRNYGLPPNMVRDNRTFGGRAVTEQIYRSRRVQTELLHIASRKPIPLISPEIIDEISETTGYTSTQVMQGLENFRPNTFSLFEISYMNMASSGTEYATEFEVATVEIFNQLGYETTHTGSLPLHPDGIAITPENYSGIFDTKAYKSYSINNDHRNRMVVNYIPLLKNSHPNSSFFLYIAHGFKSTIGNQVRRIAEETGVNGAAITAEAILELYRKNRLNPIPHIDLFPIFTSNTLISLDDINRFFDSGISVSNDQEYKVEPASRNHSVFKEVIFKKGELFCGAGGLSLGAELAEIEKDGKVYKVEHEWANDFDKDACETFRKNICPDRPESVFCQDLRNLDITNLPKIDAFSFSFPIEGYSIAEKRNAHRQNNDPLYTYGIEVLYSHQPKWFIAETGPGFANMKRLNEFIQILKEMEEAGYHVTPHQYKFEEYGIPQVRHNIIVVGIHKDLGWKFKVPKAPYKNNFYEWETAKDALENPPIPINAANHEFTVPKPRITELLSVIKPGDNAWADYIPEHLRLNVKGARMSNIYKRLDPNLPSYTVTGSGGGGTHMYHYNEPRALTNRERARLQTFPDDFEFIGGKESVRKQIGYAVPVDGAKIIIEAILKSFAGIAYETEPSNLEKDLIRWSYK
ncbi:DNA (cytosine-5-)-methyltransferase [Neobacillus vireti]|uniref:DNA (cytosine-5-)-methyltransferase n=1 Tax=Neobacillus vireti TaxID=220686 RepID=UPI002FFF92AA